MDGTKYICSWCALDNFNSYHAYREHEDLHFDMDFMNGVQREYVCSFCPWGNFIDYGEYTRHEDAHFNIRSLCSEEQPAPKRRRFFLETSGNGQKSPVPDPSHIVHDETNQMGEGPPETMQYVVEKVKEKTFKNSVVDTHFKVTFDMDQNREGEKLSNMYGVLEGMFDDIISKVTGDLQKSDLGRIIIHHDALTNPVYVSLRSLERLSGHDVMEQLQNVLNSHEELPLDQSFRVDVGTMKLPKGGRGDHINCLSGVHNSLKKKKSVILINNKGDNTCLPRAIILGFLSANQVSEKEWNQLVKKDSKKTIEELILTYKKCPSWYYYKLRNPKLGERKQALLSVLLCKNVCAPLDRLLTLNDINLFENYLNVDILVVSAKMGNRFLKVPPESSGKQRLYLYLVDSHFHTITNICGFFGSSKFCEYCLKPYQNRHQCEVSCFVCNTKGCHDHDKSKQGYVSCRYCHMTCKSLECLNQHREVRPRKGNDPLSSCDLYWKCKTCKKIVNRLKRNPQDHKCGEYECKSCNSFVDSNHLCYIRALDPKPSRSKYIFFDFECSQEDELLTCKGGYVSQRASDCEKCKDKISACKTCSRCLNCQQSWCGKYQHTPNLVIAQKVCDNCIRDDFTPNSKCHICGSRCQKCNIFNKKDKCYECPPCSETCGFRETLFKGRNTANKFCQWLFEASHKDFTVMAHNMKGYDGYFLLEYLIANSIRPENIIYAGSKIMSMTVGRGLNIRVIDSVNFLPMKLTQLPDAFMLNELKKGYFPHFFNKEANWEYKGLYPDVHYYGIDSMNTKDRKSFMKWYEEKTENDEIFDFAKEIIDYCRSDVDILRRACLTFRNILLDITGANDNTDTDDIRGIDPFNDITIAGVCSKVYRTKFLTETWEVKLRKNGELTDWIPGLKQDGQLQVYIEGTWVDELKLQRDDYLIEESRFISSPLAQVPSNGYVARDNFSKDSIRWLEWCMEHSKKSQSGPIHIQHALNGGEVIIAGSKYRADGYVGPKDGQNRTQKGGTVYEYLGCFWHGCKKCYPNRRQEIKLLRTKQSLEELYALTKKKESYIRSQGLKYVCIWEHEFKDMIHKHDTVRKCIESLDLQDRLDPRDSFFGGRTNATKLEYKIKDGEKIHYVDFTSLYPYVNKYTKYPVGQPSIITENFNCIDDYFGIAKVKVLPPKGMYHPVLPQRFNGKLTFALCKTCAESQNQDPCRCTDEERAMIGTWCTPELGKAVESGYRIIKIYEVYHFEKTSQYDPSSQRSGLFDEYINLFLKIKQESSGWPTWVKTEDDAARYIEQYYQHEGIRLNPDKIKKNKALRSLAKLLLNSFWGKFGQRLNMPQSSFFHEFEADKFFRCISDPSKNIKDFHIVTDDTIQVSWDSNDRFVQESAQTNIFIATMTTCWARLKLYSILEMLGHRTMYHDTDSIIFVSRPGDIDPELGDFLGQLTNELDDNDYIVHFVSGGPKQYAYKTVQGKHECKIRGFTLNHTNSKLLNLESMLNLIEPNLTNGSISVVNANKITRNKRKRTIFSSVEEKHYKIVYTKRVIRWDTLDTVPFGY